MPRTGQPYSIGRAYSAPAPANALVGSAPYSIDAARRPERRGARLRALDAIGRVASSPAAVRSASSAAARSSVSASRSAPTNWTSAPGIRSRADRLGLGVLRDEPRGRRAEHGLAHDRPLEIARHVRAGLVAADRQRVEDHGSCDRLTGAR